MNKKSIILVVLIGILSLTGISLFLYTSQRNTSNKNNEILINESIDKNGITITLESLILEDKKITVNYQLTDSIKKIISLKLLVNETELNSLTGIAEGENDNLSEELLFLECPYKVGDILDIQFQIYDKEDETLSHPEVLTFTVPVNKILPTTELVLNKEISMKRGNPKVIQKVLFTEKKVHVFHDSFKGDIEFKTKNGDIYYKLSTISLEDTTSVTNIPIKENITNGTLQISGDSVAKEQSIEIIENK